MYNPATPDGRVRMLVNDVNDSAPIFSDEEITAFLDMEGENVKRAAAQALDTIADNEALRSKVITTQDVSVDGAKLAAVLHQRADTLRKQASLVDDDESGWAFEVAAFAPYGQSVPELTEYPYGYSGWLYP